MEVGGSDGGGGGGGGGGPNEFQRFDRWTTEMESSGIHETSTVDDAAGGVRLIELMLIIGGGKIAGKLMENWRKIEENL